MVDHAAQSMMRREFLEKLGTRFPGCDGRRRLWLRAGPWHETQRANKVWEPVSDRKVRVGIVGYGVCQFGAAFGFQDHPNVEIVAVSDLIPERRNGLMEACRCGKSYDSLEVLVKDPKIEAVFVATDAPSHARHCIEVLNHGKHVMTAVPAVFGSIEQAEQLVETVQKTGLKYMMAETSCYPRRLLRHAADLPRRRLRPADLLRRRVLPLQPDADPLVQGMADRHAAPVVSDALDRLLHRRHRQAVHLRLVRRLQRAASRLQARGQRVRQPLQRRNRPVPDQRRRLAPACSCARACSAPSTRRAGSSARKAT